METDVKLAQTTKEDVNPLTPYQEYGGIFKMEKKIVMFRGHTVPLNNIAQVLSYPVKPKYKLKIIDIIKLFLIGIFLIVLKGASSPSIFSDFGGGSRNYYRDDSPGVLGSVLILLILLCFAGVVYGIWERSRPPLFGFTIELTSGNYYPIVHTDKRFIDQIYNGFTQAIRESKDFEANFQNLTINNNKGTFAGTNIYDSTVIGRDNHGAVSGRNSNIKTDA